MVLIVAMVIIVSFLITLHTGEGKRFGQTVMMFMLKYFDIFQLQ